ncbi:MAG TPA: RNA polymerase sigma factor [Chitinophagaceae bacterium]
MTADAPTQRLLRNSYYHNTRWRDLENLIRIITGCIAKEHKHQKAVYENYRGYALKIVFRYIYRYEKALDVVNEGFVKLFNSFEKFDCDKEADIERKLMGWLKTIMINTSIDALRKDSMLPEIGGVPDYVWEISDKCNDADQLLLYKDLVTLIKKLPAVYRAVFNLYVIDGYSHIEISGMLNIPIGTSKSNLSRARQMLQSSIKKMENAKVCRI